MDVSSRKDDGGTPMLKIGDFSKLSSPPRICAPLTPPA